MSEPRLRKTAIIPLFDGQPIIPSSRSARRHARRAGQGGPARRRRALSLTGLSTVAPFLRSRRRKRLDAEHGISPALQPFWLLSGRNSTYPAVQISRASSLAVAALGELEEEARLLERPVRGRAAPPVTRAYRSGAADEAV